VPHGGRRSRLRFVDKAEFTEVVAEMVADQAPRVLAIVLEYGEHIDAQIIAWGRWHSMKART
jgi:hypothetical protein